MGDALGCCLGNGGGLLDDNVSIIRLLRVFLGATVRDDEDIASPTARSAARAAAEKSARSERAGELPFPTEAPVRRNFLEPQPTSAEHKDQPLARAAAAAATAMAAAREQAGCTLWDMSADEGHASAMCAAGLAAVSCKVLGDCADAKARATAPALATGTTSNEKSAENPGSKVGELAVPAPAVAGDADTAEGTGEPLIPPGEEGVERLREVACGLLANVCSHRGLRPQVAGVPSLGEKLLRTFHDSDDPAPLTELLRLFSAVALAKTTTASTADSVVAAAAMTARGDGDETRAGCEEESMSSTGAWAGLKAAPEAAVAGGAVDLPLGLAELETLERLAFFLENSLEERLLAWACSLTYSLMYRHGDAVIRPLVDFYRLEESLTALLITRSTDLSYEKLGETETGLDVLLRCLEVLCTSEVSSLGPSPPPVTGALPRGSTGPPADALAAAAMAAAAEGRWANTVPDWEQQQRNLRNEEEGRGGGDEGGQGAGEDRVGARGNGEVTPLMIVTTKTRNAFSRRDKRGGVIRGLVATLVPWEHSRRVQRGALLVLGNVIGNALEEDSENHPQGFSHAEEGGEEARCASGSCAEELDKSLLTWDSGGNGEWGGGGKEQADAESAGVGRSANTRRKFQAAVNKLVGDGEEDGLGDELQEAVETIKYVLDKLSAEEPRATDTAALGVSS